MGQFSDFFNFNRLLTPTILKYVYWVVSALILIVGCYQIFLVIKTLIGGELLQALQLLVMCLITTPLFLILWRVMCERILVSFLIEARLREMNNRLGGHR